MSKDYPDLAMYQATAFDRFAVRTPLFLELGKRDFFENTPLGLRPLRNERLEVVLHLRRP